MCEFPVTQAKLEIKQWNLYYIKLAKKLFNKAQGTDAN